MSMHEKTCMIPITVNLQATAKITEVANRLASKRCEKYEMRCKAGALRNVLQRFAMQWFVSKKHSTAL